MDRMMLLVFLFLCFATMTAAVTYASAAVDRESHVTVTVNQLLHSENPADPLSLSESSFPGQAMSSTVSSQCWRTAIEILQVSVDRSVRADSAAALCSSLTEIQLKRLALEIASCHMKDVDKNMYQNVAIKELCSKAMINAETVQMCLQNLTDLGFHTYTQFLPYVQILCTRKTQEFFLDHQQDVIRNIAQNYAQIVSQSNELLALQTEQMNRLFEIPILVKEQVSAELEVNLHDARKQLNYLLHNETTKMNLLVTDVVDHLQQRDREHRDRMDDWTSYQASMLLQQSREMERHRSLIEEHRLKVQGLSETVAQTTKHMRPLLDLQAVMQLASDGYSWVTFLLYFLGTFNIIWIVTRLERCHEFRSYLFGLVCAEAIAEIALTSAVSYRVLSDVDRLVYIKELRRWALFVECFTYVFGIIVSLLNSMSLKVGAKVLNTSGEYGEVCCSSKIHREDFASERQVTAEIGIHTQTNLEKKLDNAAADFGPTRIGLMSSLSSRPVDRVHCSNWGRPHKIPRCHVDPSKVIPIEELNFPIQFIQRPSQLNVAKPTVESQSRANESLRRRQKSATSEVNSTETFRNDDDDVFRAAIYPSSLAVPSSTNMELSETDIERLSLKRSASSSLLPTETRLSKRIAIANGSSKYP
jgi:hypothetical protein